MNGSVCEGASVRVSLCMYSMCTCSMCVCVFVHRLGTQPYSDEIDHFSKSNSLTHATLNPHTHTKSLLSLFPPYKSTNTYRLPHTHLNLLLNSSMSQAKVQASSTQIRFRLHSYNVALLKNTNAQQKEIKTKILSQPFASDLQENPTWLHSVRNVRWYFLHATQNARPNTVVGFNYATLFYQPHVYESDCWTTQRKVPVQITYFS